VTGYLWRGKPDLEALNAAIVAARNGTAARIEPAPGYRTGKTCRNGHQREGNTQIRPDGTRRCRACRAALRVRGKAAA